MTDSNGSDTNGHLYQTNLTQHGVLIGAASGVLSSTAVGSTGQIFQGNTGADPSYSTATYPSTATGTGTILRADGTNWSASTNTYPNTATTGDILIATGTNVIGSLADVAVHQVLVSGGVGVAPAYSASPQITALGVGAAAGASGITFNGTDLMSAYAIGTFTPTIDGTVSGTTTYNLQVGNYIKIGKFVSATFYASWTAMTGTGNLVFGGLPFAIANISNYEPIAVCETQQLTYGTGGTFAIAEGTPNTSGGILTSPGSNAKQPIPVTATANVKFTINYISTT